MRASMHLHDHSGVPPGMMRCIHIAPDAVEQAAPACPHHRRAKSKHPVV